VPVFSGAADAHWSVSFGDVGDNDDFWIARNAPALTEYIELDFAKAASERDLLCRTEALVAEEDDAMQIVGVLNRGKDFVPEGLG
jgi:hypothetical protein